MNRRITSGFFLGWIWLATAAAQGTVPEAAHSGQVTLPLDEYQQLIEQSSWDPQPAPSAYAIGQSDLKISFSERDRRVTASVEARVQVETD